MVRDNQSGSPEMTRRDFLTGQWFDGAGEENTQNEQKRNDEEMVSDDELEQNRDSPRLRLALARLGLIVAVVVGVTVLGGVVTASLPDSTTQTTGLEDSAMQGISTTVLTVGEDNQTECSAPVQDRDRAHTLYDDLQEIKEDELVPVSDETHSAIADQLEAGDASFNLGDYCEAASAYERAIETAEAALAEAYLEGAERHLQATQTLVDTEQNSTFPNPEAAGFAEQVSIQSTALTENGSLEGRAQTYEEARTLHDEAEAELTVGLLGRFITPITSQWLLTAFAGLMMLFAGIEAVALWRLVRTNRDRTIPHTSR